jgi:hypothetical protein
VKPRYIDIDGRRHLWSELLELRRTQLAECREAHQPALFELRADMRPETARTAAGRYLEPGLFDD